MSSLELHTTHTTRELAIIFDFPGFTTVATNIIFAVKVLKPFGAALWTFPLAGERIFTNCKKKFDLKIE